MLLCGLHKCKQRCHSAAVLDHSRLQCRELLVDTCSLGHKEKRKCHEPSGTCKRCEKEKKEQAKKLQKEYEEQQRRAAQQVAHDKRLKELEERIVEQRQKVKDEELRLQQEQILAQKRQDLADATKEAREARANPTSYFKQLFSPFLSSSTSSTPSNTTQPTSNTSNATPSVQGSTPTPGHMHQNPPPRPATPPGNAATMNHSSPEAEWKRQKLLEGASNPHMDAVMDMIGLEEVKRQMLGIKDKIDVVQRQNTSLKGERFNVTFLGNPGTGMRMHLRLSAESSA
jgi:hypothetical protein